MTRHCPVGGGGCGARSTLEVDETPPPSWAEGCGALSTFSDGGQGGVGGAAVKGEVLDAVGADLDDRAGAPGDRGGTPGDRPLDRGAELVEAARAFEPAPVQRRRVREVEAVGGGDVLLEGVRFAGERPGAEEACRRV